MASSTAPVDGSLVPAFKFLHPFRCIVAAPSQSGKTHLVCTILKHIDQLIDTTTPIQKIIWYYAVWQQDYDQLLIDMTRLHPAINLEFQQGLPPQDYADRFKDRIPRLIILDDLMTAVNNTISELFSLGSHHLNLSLFYLTQNLYSKNKHTRDLNLNSTYLILFKNIRDSSQIQHIARQIYPNQGRFLVDAYKDAVNAAPYAFLLIDLHPRTVDQLRIRGATSLVTTEPTATQQQLASQQWLYIPK